MAEQLANPGYYLDHSLERLGFVALGSLGAKAIVYPPASAAVVHSLWRRTKTTNFRPWMPASTYRYLSTDR